MFKLVKGFRKENLLEYGFKKKYNTNTGKAESYNSESHIYVDVGSRDLHIRRSYQYGYRENGLVGNFMGNINRLHELHLTLGDLKVIHELTKNNIIEWETIKDIDKDS